MEKLGNSPENNLIFTPENIQTILRDIGKRREQKGSSEQLIPQIRDLRRQSEKLGDLTTVLTLFQEESLCAQHMIMESKTSNPIRAGKGLLLMTNISKYMSSFQKDNMNKIDPIVNARTFRFLGRQADHLHQFKKSENLYQQALSFFENLNKPEQRYHRLELSGFLAFSQLKQNNPAWFDLTTKTLSDFDEAPEGIWLKDNNYYTWAVWKSGIEIRNSDSLLGKKSNTLKYKTNIISWLDDANLILKDQNLSQIPQIRLDELSQVKSKLR
jgi:hypothetical protein